MRRGKDMTTMVGVGADIVVGLAASGTIEKM